MDIAQLTTSIRLLAEQLQPFQPPYFYSTMSQYKNNAGELKGIFSLSDLFGSTSLPLSLQNGSGTSGFASRSGISDGSNTEHKHQFEEHIALMGEWSSPDTDKKVHGEQCLSMYVEASVNTPSLSDASTIFARVLKENHNSTSISKELRNRSEIRNLAATLLSPQDPRSSCELTVVLDDCVLHCHSKLTQGQIKAWHESYSLSPAECPEPKDGSTDRPSKETKVDKISSDNVVGTATLNVTFKLCWPRGEPGQPDNFSSFEPEYGPLRHEDDDVEISDGSEDYSD